MIQKVLSILLTLITAFSIGCSSQNNEDITKNENDENVVTVTNSPTPTPIPPANPPNNDPPTNTQASYKTKTNIRYLALGDSYTKGESVITEKSFPRQLKERIEIRTDKKVTVEIIAQTGWRTDDLIEGIENRGVDDNYDLVSLLIGVNNQFQGANFQQYRTEFKQLLDTAIHLAQDNKKNVFVVSIPDYAFTPLGGGNKQISEEIDQYNNYARRETIGRNIPFIEITEITRRGLKEPNLVANDGLHPSADAYAEFVREIYEVLF